LFRPDFTTYLARTRGSAPFANVTTHRLKIPRSCQQPSGSAVTAIAGTTSTAPSWRRLTNLSPVRTSTSIVCRPPFRCQFHQHFMHVFYVQKPFVLPYSNYSLALLFFGKRILAEKLLVKCWWNWPQVEEIKSLEEEKVILFSKKQHSWTLKLNYFCPRNLSQVIDFVDNILLNKYVFIWIQVTK